MMSCTGIILAVSCMISRSLLHPRLKLKMKLKTGGGLSGREGGKEGGLNNRRRLN